MNALWLENGVLEHRAAVDPEIGPGEALVQVITAGICGTDAALVAGMYVFTGIPGHEFVGRVAEGPEDWIGERVVGEINVSCGSCEMCRGGQRKHCTRRTAIGIRGRNGAFADYLALPLENLHRVPAKVSDDAATFTEPLAAALDVLEHIAPGESDTVLVVGDGKLGQLVCRALAHHSVRVDVSGRHRRKLDRLEGIVNRSFLDEPAPDRSYSFTIECTGRAEGLATALNALKPRGTLVMKTTAVKPSRLDAARLVVDELRIVGSRCGRFDHALKLLADRSIDPEPLIDARFPLAEGKAAFAKSRQAGVLKVLLDVGAA